MQIPHSFLNFKFQQKFETYFGDNTVPKALCNAKGVCRESQLRSYKKQSSYENNNYKTGKITLKKQCNYTKT